MVAPNPEDVLTSRVRRALVALLVASLDADPPADGEVATEGDPGAPLDRRQLYGRHVLASVVLGYAWAPALLSTAITAALDWFVAHERALEAFEAEVRRAIGEMVPDLARLADAGDLDPSSPSLVLVSDAAEGRTPRLNLGRAVEATINLYREGVRAPWRRLHEADCRTPYAVPVLAPTAFVAVIRPYGYEEGEWEYDLGTLSPDLATLRRRVARDGDHGDDVIVGYAEVRLRPAVAGENPERQTDTCDAAVREQGGVASYDLHSFMADGAGICEVVTNYPIDPHPAGPIVRTATVRLVLVRVTLLDASGTEGGPNG